MVSANYRNAIYGKKLWQQLNAAPNAFAAFQKASNFMDCEVCGCELKDGTYITEDKRNLCKKCYDEELTYTSKW